MLKSLFIAYFAFLSVPAFAQDFDAASVVTSVEVTRLDNSDGKATVELPKNPVNPINEVAMYIDSIIAIGKKIWPIIEAGRPVINTSGVADSLSILPRIEGTRSELHNMANWSAPKVISYRVSYKNYFGSEVIGFTYTLFFQHSGSLQGKGKYITSLKAQASHISASWGFDFDVTSELVSVANVGTDADPVASAILQVGYKARGLLNEEQTVRSFYVDGNGTLQALNN